MATNPAAVYKAPFRQALKDFTRIGPVGQSFYVLVVQSSLPVNTVQELVAMAKTKPKRG
jgi:tripartite-type tricarboxylate transporter receptor subunit TctC